MTSEKNELEASNRRRGKIALCSYPSTKSGTNEKNYEQSNKKNKTNTKICYRTPPLAVLFRSPIQIPNLTMRFFPSLTAPPNQLFLVYLPTADGGELPRSQEADYFLVYHAVVRPPQHPGISSCWLVRAPELESGSTDELFPLQDLS